jgi:hypothetical protein
VSHKRVIWKRNKHINLMGFDCSCVNWTELVQDAAQTRAAKVPFGSVGCSLPRAKVLYLPVGYVSFLVSSF